MKETTKNNIVRYAISAAFVTTFLIVTLSIAIGLDWLTDKTGWPVSQSFCIIGFVYVVWSLGKAITEFKEEDEKIRKEMKDTDIEYTRTDVFIQKALAYLNIKFYFNNLHNAVESDAFNCMEEMFEDFKKFLEEEI